jgi:hypothetical protein
LYYNVFVSCFIAIGLLAMPFTYLEGSIF